MILTKKIVKTIILNSKNKKVEVLRPKSLKILLKTIKQQECKNVLEIGTGLGYSAFMMLKKTNINNLTTIEKDLNRFFEAQTNLLRFKDRITLINQDCFDYVPNEKFNLIFIDGPKKNQIELINKYKIYLKNNGIIYIDNIFLNKFRLLTNQTENQKNILKSIDDLVLWIKNQKEFKFKFHNIEDGIAILYKD